MKQRITRITTPRILTTQFHDALMSQWRIQRDAGGLFESPPRPVLKYSTKMNQFGLSETKFFHFYGIFKSK